MKSGRLMDKHHMFPRSRFKKLARAKWNLLRINLMRHRSLHRLYGLRSFDEIIGLLETRTDNVSWFTVDKYCYVGSVDWMILHGRKTAREAADHLKRVRRAKYRLR